MKTTILFFLTLAVPFARGESLPCDEKLQVLEEQGVHRGAFIEALKHEGGKPSRYVFLLRAGPERTGYVFMIDTLTGRVEEYKAGHGYNENDPNAPGGGTPAATTYFGPMILNPASADAKGGKIATERVPPNEKSQADPQDIVVGAKLDMCGLINGNDICLKKEDFDGISRKLLAEKKANPEARPMMYVYPRLKTNQYLASRPKGQVDVCRRLEAMKTQSASGAPASPNQGATGQN